MSETDARTPELDRTGQRLGAFRVVREVGRGGMGTVYLAERADDQFEQRVAIKVLKRGTDTDEVLRRFLRERQILANLKHPHIASLVDGGVSPDGLPFFALEYVEGEPFTAYCAARHLRVEDRLRLFLDVCAAVESAHRALIVHRDLKPSNILVADGGYVKLLDFGIAKLLARGAEQALTLTDLRLLTPQYAAPEQVRGDPVTTATDVYALGLLLYELLTGERAQHPKSTDAKAVHEAVVETAAARPSTAATSSSGLEVSDLRRRLRGDLDRIVLKALQKEPERRYRSVDAFAEDVRRHLAGLPVAAQGDRVSYRVGKFVRRHRFAVAAVAMVLVALVGGLVTTLWQARAARMQARRAEDVQKFLIGLFEVADPSESKGATVTARDLLMRGAERVDKELAAQPENRAQIVRTIARIQTSLGLYDEAIAQAEKALALDRESHPGDAPAVADDLTILANALMQKTDFARAETVAVKALALETRLHGAKSAEAASAETDLAAVRYEQGKFDEAERLNDDALAIRRSRFGEDSLEVGYSFKALAEDYYKQGEYPKAEAHARGRSPVSATPWAEEGSDRRDADAGPALYLGAQAKFDQAELLFKQTIALRTKVLGAGHPDVAITQKELLNVYNRMGKWERECAAHSRDPSTYKRAYGERARTTPMRSMTWRSSIRARRLPGGRDDPAPGAGDLARSPRRDTDYLRAQQSRRDPAGRRLCGRRGPLFAAGSRSASARRRRSSGCSARWNNLGCSAPERAAGRSQEGALASALGLSRRRRREPPTPRTRCSTSGSTRPRSVTPVRPSRSCANRSRSIASTSPTDIHASRKSASDSVRSWSSPAAPRRPSRCCAKPWRCARSDSPPRTGARPRPSSSSGAAW